MRKAKIGIVALVAATVLFIASCGGSSETIDRETETDPAVTPGTVYVQTVGHYNPTKPDRPIDNSGTYSNVLRPTWTFNDGTILTNMVKDQGHRFRIVVKNGIGQLKVAYHTDAPFYVQADNKWGFKQIDREKAAGRPVPAYVTELGTFAQGVMYNYNGSQELVGATIMWHRDIPFDTPIPLRNGVSATPEGMADVGRRLNGWEYMSAVIRETITIRQQTGNWLTAFVQAVGVVGAYAIVAAAPAACPDEQNLSSAIFIDGGGNGSVDTGGTPAFNITLSSGLDGDSLCLDETTTLVATATADGDNVNSSTSFAWVKTFGQGNISATTGSSVTYTPSKAGMVTIGVTATRGNQTASASVSFPVVDCTPVVEDCILLWDPVPVTAPNERTNFTASVKSNNSWTLTFTDPDTAAAVALVVNGGSAVSTFNGSGNQTLTITAPDAPAGGREVQMKLTGTSGDCSGETDIHSILVVNTDEPLPGDPYIRFVAPYPTGHPNFNVPGGGGSSDTGEFFTEHSQGYVDFVIIGPSEAEAQPQAPEFDSVIVVYKRAGSYKLIARLFVDEAAFDRGDAPIATDEEDFTVN